MQELQLSGDFNTCNVQCGSGKKMLVRVVETPHTSAQSTFPTVKTRANHSINPVICFLAFMMVTHCLLLHPWALCHCCCIPRHCPDPSSMSLSLAPPHPDRPGRPKV